MGFKCGIVGLPNVGKSTLFNALTASKGAQAANYPFCTIEPNIGMVPVPDPRVDFLVQSYGSQKIIPAFLKVVDIAGLVKGASQGEGLGNQFLTHIRECEAILHMVRCFEDENVTHVEGGVDPVRDLEIIETELLLKDLEICEKKIDKLERESRRDKKLLPQLENSKAILEKIKEGISVRALLGDFDTESTQDYLTSKPVLFIGNVSMDDISIGGGESFEKLKSYLKPLGFEPLMLSAQVESELIELDPAERVEFLNELGLNESGLQQLARKGYSLLGLMTFFTAGPKEVHSWTVEKGCLAPQAAGKIHSDMEKGFIRAEVFHFEDLKTCKTEAKIKDTGLLRVEGREYPIKDGDILHIRFAV